MHHISYVTLDTFVIETWRLGQRISNPFLCNNRNTFTRSYMCICTHIYIYLVKRIEYNKFRINQSVFVVQCSALSKRDMFDSG